METRPTEDAVAQAYRMARPCRLCPRRCGVDRLEGEEGYCGIGATPRVSSVSPHFGEEPCLVGRGGSGTIFLAGCNLLCVFCQNYDISHRRLGSPAGPDRIARAMSALQQRSCANVNFVTPTHVVPWLMDAVRRARLDGLNVPTVYNCGGYESVEMLRLLEGTVDIYMPDAKFWDPDSARRYLNAPDYPERMREALQEMQRQVGDLSIQDGVARSGLLIRHLVMPGCVEQSRHILRFIAEQVSPNAHVNVMSQYRPLYKARDHPRIDRPISAEEYAGARGCAQQLGLNLV